MYKSTYIPKGRKDPTPKLRREKKIEQPAKRMKATVARKPEPPSEFDKYAFYPKGGVHARRHDTPMSFWPNTRLGNFEKFENAHFLEGWGGRNFADWYHRETRKYHNKELNRQYLAMRGMEFSGPKPLSIPPDRWWPLFKADGYPRFEGAQMKHKTWPWHDSWPIDYDLGFKWLRDDSTSNAIQTVMKDEESKLYEQITAFL